MPTDESAESLDVPGFGAALVRRREALGWTQNQLARRADLSPSYLAKIEQGKGRRPGIEVIGSLARALGVGTEDLLIDMGLPVKERLPEDVAAIYKELAQPERQAWLDMGRALLELREGYRVLHQGGSQPEREESSE